MFRIAPFRRRNHDWFFPESFADAFDWPTTSWQGFNVDVKETAEGYELKADLPGVNKENISLSVEDGYLTIIARQEEFNSADGENFIRRERRHFSSQRRFYVGNVSPEDVLARHENGVLTVTFPKATEGPNNRQIPIH
ncbi:MAG: Hsp20/alpha crystallin family protein [Firmicutes bacterium]|nr:Hsp20/alpha crystallin family protein [Bacillota bacterium]